MWRSYVDALIFIDTNILLDFYRYPQGSAVLPILSHIDANHNKIITGNQIEMEFKKNRQKVILDSLGFLKGPEWGSFKIPVILSQAQPAVAISRNKAAIARQSKRLRKRIEAVLRNPAQNDVVYQTAQRLFRNTSPLNLTRENKIRFTIRNLAKKRFMLGYPPRKPDDTSLGDPINWEWIIHCAKESNTNVVVVSRDSDYGYRYEDEPIINDWLLQEFKDRVSRRKKVVLTNRLTHAFELTKVAVKAREVADEGKLIDEITASSSDTPISFTYNWPNLSAEEYEKFLDKFREFAEEISKQYPIEPPKKT